MFMSPQNKIQILKLSQMPFLDPVAAAVESTLDSILMKDEDVEPAVRVIV